MTSQASLRAERELLEELEEMEEANALDSALLLEPQDGQRWEDLRSQENDGSKRILAKEISSQIEKKLFKNQDSIGFRIFGALRCEKAIGQAEASTLQLRRLRCQLKPLEAQLAHEEAQQLQLQGVSQDGAV